MKAQELINQLQNEIDHYRATIDDRHKRISEGLTDMDDCYISQRMNSLHIDLAQTKIEILENNGFAQFDVLRDIETDEIISKKEVLGQYGVCHLIDDEYVSKFGRFVGCAKKESTYTKKGLKQDVAQLPAWATTKANGSGMYGAYMSSVVVFPSKKNYAV